MRGNVPDDWGMYWRTCPVCDSRYHASDGECGCGDYFAELEPCECGECAWEIQEDDHPWNRRQHWQQSIRCELCNKMPGSGGTSCTHTFPDRD